MSLGLAELRKKAVKIKMSRAEILALMPKKVYDDGRTKQCFRDECNIEKIMARADVTGTISHMAKYEGVYADFSDFDFHKQNNMLARGAEIFAALPAEIRKEFNQSEAEFFKYVNDPANADDLANKLPMLAAPGKQNIKVAAPDADAEAAVAAANTITEPVSAAVKTTVTETVTEPLAT